MTESCAEIRRRLEAGGAASDADAAAHIQACEGCRAHAAILAVLGRLEPPQADPESVRRVMAALPPAAWQRRRLAAWLPLAIVLAAACTVPHARIAGGAFALVIIGGFLYAGIRIDNNPQYQRPNLRGVATALGHPVVRRAVVAYDGDFAAQPLAVYLRGVPWPPGPNVPATVNEVDIVGGGWQTIPNPLPAGVRLIARTPVDGFLVARFALQPAWQGAPATLGARAGALLTPAAASPRVLIQRPGA